MTSTPRTGRHAGPRSTISTFASNHRQLLALVLAAAAVVLAGTAMRANPTPAPKVTHPVAVGTVVNEQGAPVGGASITAGSRKARTGADGRFELRLDRARFATVTGSGHLSRSIALAPGEDTTVPLTSRAGGAFSIRFGGDAMAGRRLFQASDGGEPLLPAKPSADDHARLLDGIEPLLSDSDVSVVNLETPLVDSPPTTTEGPRPKGFHPTKELFFASATTMAQGLKNSGVTAVSLGNNHVADALGPGLESTIQALDAAKVARFGGGRTLEEAWRPAYVRAGESTLALIGCTTVTGTQTPPLYVATETQGGAAECDPAKVASTVSEARERSDAVAVMIHGGVEYQRQQTPDVRELTTVAVRSGATAVMNAHPHVAGPLRLEGAAAVSDSLGNLLFDQDLGATTSSYLARADVRQGRLVSSSADPYIIDNYQPYAVTGAIRDSISRMSAGPGALIAGPGLQLSARAPQRRTQSVEVDSRVRRLPDGGWVSAARPGVRLGTDLLLGSGDFERQTTSRRSRSPMWTLGKEARLTTTAATQGERGLSLARSPASQRNVVAHPSYRVPVTPGQSLSLVADLQSSGGGAELELRWYSAMAGSSTGVVSLPLPEGDFGSTPRQVRLDVTVPKGVVAVQPHVRQVPTADGVTGPITELDAVKLVAWAPAQATGRPYNIASATKRSTLTVQMDRP